MSLVLPKWNMGPQELIVCVPSYTQVPSYEAVVLQSRGCLCRINPSASLLSQLSPPPPPHPLLQQNWEVWEKQSSCAVDGSCRDLQRHRMGFWAPLVMNATESPVARALGDKMSAGVRSCELGRVLGALQLPTWPGSSVAILDGLQCSGRLCLLFHWTPKETMLCFRDTSKGEAESFLHGKGRKWSAINDFMGGKDWNVSEEQEWGCSGVDVSRWGQLNPENCTQKMTLKSDNCICEEKWNSNCIKLPLVICY